MGLVKEQERPQIGLRVPKTRGEQLANEVTKSIWLQQRGKQKQKQHGTLRRRGGGRLQLQLEQIQLPLLEQNRRRRRIGRQTELSTPGRGADEREGEEQGD